MFDNEIVEAIKINFLCEEMMDLFVNFIVSEINREEEFGCMAKMLPNKEKFAEMVLHFFRTRVQKNLELENLRNFTSTEDLFFSIVEDAFKDITKWCRLQNAN